MRRSRTGNLAFGKTRGGGGNYPRLPSIRCNGRRNCTLFFLFLLLFSPRYVAVGNFHDLSVTYILEEKLSAECVQITATSYRLSDLLGALLLSFQRNSLYSRCYDQFQFPATINTFYGAFFRIYFTSRTLYSTELRRNSLLEQS